MRAWLAMNDLQCFNSSYKIILRHVNIIHNLYNSAANWLWGQIFVYFVNCTFSLFQVFSKSSNDIVQDMDLDLVLTETPPTRKKIRKHARSLKLPYCFVYVAWIALCLVCFICVFFVVLYGLQFGKNVSARWLSSLTISFFQDVLISEPIKVSI